MKLCKLEDIVGNEKLARPIMTSNYQELLAAGTILKPEYIPKIIQLGITEVFIEDDRLSPEQVVILREDVEDIFREKVRSVLERHIYNDNSELEELTKTADSIISNILENDALVEQIYDIQERSADIYEHSISVCSLAVLIAIKRKIDKTRIHDLGVACLFHDIGLRYLDFDYSNQIISEMDEKKIIEYHKHPAYAYSALEREEWISKSAKNMILQHHERLDGSGYPLHVREFEPEAEILQICDAFDEMICGIGCKRARVYEAVEYMKVSKGVLYDEDVVNTLLDFTAVYPAGTVVVLNTNEMGIVIKQNKQFPERPVLRIIKNAKGEMLEEDRICDLVEIKNVYIEKVLL
ncbi:MAG: HD domain-containing protein [Lachnospiraceae bacterium]|jgi:HD-GYP domain-containing protein (c-di-GMP phosphodiesterase class II)|nr:HD domain-containing protein [Lachnospiraceae bacterium]